MLNVVGCAAEIVCWIKSVCVGRYFGADISFMFVCLSEVEGYMKKKILSGGQNEVVLIGESVHRPRHHWSETTRRLLAVCRKAGLDFVPQWKGVDAEGNEVFSYISGEVGNDPWPRFMKEDVAVVSAGVNLRRFHDATEKLIGEAGLRWQFEAMHPVMVVCHGDYAPYNCVFDRHGEMKGLIDFDCARLGPVSWELAYSIYRFGPLVDYGNWVDGFGGDEDRIRRIKLFVDAYGGSRADLLEAVEMIPKRLGFIVEWMHQQADEGNQLCKQNLRDGHHELYLRDMVALADFSEKLK